MRSFSISRVLDRHTRSVAAAVGLLLATLAPAIVPAFAAADLVTDRSITLSSSAKNATAVSYEVTFTAVNTAGAVVVEFCSNTPLIGESCTSPATTPGGFTAASATASGGAVIYGSPTANKVIVTKSITAGSNTFTLGNITNPNAAGSLYARIVTYDTDAHADSEYTTTALGADAKDQGSVALSITDGVNVSGKVLETLLFCVAGEDPNTHDNPIGAGCSGGPLPAPTLELGETVGSVKALSSSAVSTGDVYTQISTNAAGGAVINLKSGNTCGGLKRLGASVCDIEPATAGFTATGAALFGVKVAADSTTDTAQSASGTLQVHSGSNYDGSSYRLNWVSGNATGVGSVYGDPILDTGVTQPSNRNMKLTFGATITNNTPAGNYSTDLSLIATGKF